MMRRRHPSEEMERLHRHGLTPGPELAAAGYAELARHMRIVGALAIGSFVGWALTHAVFMAILTLGYLGALAVNVPHVVYAARLVHRYAADRPLLSATAATTNASVASGAATRPVLRPVR